MDANIILPEEFYTSFFYTGSSIICDPPVLDTDLDIMFLTEDSKTFEMELKEAGWQSCGLEEYEETEDSCWKAYRKGKLNYLFTDNKEYYDQFQAATLDAKEKNLLKKEDRIALFDTYLNKFKKDLTPEQKQSIIKAKKKKYGSFLIDEILYNPLGNNPTWFIQPYPRPQPEILLIMLPPASPTQQHGSLI